MGGCPGADQRTCKFVDLVEELEGQEPNATFSPTHLPHILSYPHMKQKLHGPTPRDWGDTGLGANTNTGKNPHKVEGDDKSSGKFHYKLSTLNTKASRQIAQLQKNKTAFLNENEGFLLENERPYTVEGNRQGKGLIQKVLQPNE